MKNVKIFEQIRLRAMIDYDHYRVMRDNAEQMADKAFRMSKGLLSEFYEKEFHTWCERKREYQKLMEREKPFTKEKWYMTEFLYSDAHAYEVVEVYSRDKMDVRRLNATEKPEAKEARLASFIPGGFCGNFDNSLQDWTFESDEKQPILTVRRHKDGKFYRPNTRTCSFVPQTEPYEWYDFNF